MKQIKLPKEIYSQETKGEVRRFESYETELAEQHARELECLGRRFTVDLDGDGGIIITTP